MADSPLTDSDGALVVIVKVDGTQIEDWIELRRVSVETRLNAIPTAVLSFADGSIAEQSFDLTDADTFKPGAEIEIAAAYGDGEAQVLFKGVVTAVRLRIRGQSGSELEVSCRDKAIAMAGVRKTAVFAEQTDSDVISAIASDAGLTATVDAVSGAEPSDVVQHEVSDWDFIRLLADRNGLVVAVEDGALTVAAPDMAAAASMTLTLGVDVIEFDGRIDAAPAVSSVTVAGWDSAAQAVSASSETVQNATQWGDLPLSDVTSVTGDRDMRVPTPNAAGQVDPATVAKARAIRVAPAVQGGTVRYMGSILAKPGTTIELTGLGERMGGTAYVSGVTHRIRPGSWSTTASLGLPADWRSDAPAFAAPAAGALASPAQGLYVAKVLQITEGAGSAFADACMIKVQIPLMGDPPTEIWARFAQPYASESAGIQFLPETGDEVIVGFLAADPGAAVILGALHSSVNPRVNEAADPNALKTIASQSGIKMTFDDDNVILTIETPGGHSAVFDDGANTVTITDATGNTLEMSEGGVSLAVEGTLDISATGAITVAGDADISLEATGDANVAGMNVNAEAQTGATVKGSASAEISSSGQTTVKGSMVMIN